ncbi:hypothetical protein L2E82_27499 [Cichorium intybus]|uniref:Uncharacterized protein n=1 Tax=Cichorium intybus TaxID=13427 RepID=A0ACB9CTG5_CICIN|nr:hypothetical protein L2E82_27499 [Cichorium intybus]
MLANIHYYLLKKHATETVHPGDYGRCLHQYLSSQSVVLGANFLSILICVLIRSLVLDFDCGECAGDSFWWCNAMVLINSPNRRPQTAFSSPSFRKQHTKGDELGSFTTVIRRHRFLLTALALLAFLCTIYLYFAVTLGEDYSDTCSGLIGTQKALCQAQHVKQTVAKGKMKIL